MLKIKSQGNTRLIRYIEAEIYNQNHGHDPWSQGLHNTKAQELLTQRNRREEKMTGAPCWFSWYTAYLTGQTIRTQRHDKVPVFAYIYTHMFENIEMPEMRRSVISRYRESELRTGQISTSRTSWWLLQAMAWLWTLAGHLRKKRTTCTY